jgi:hypothetical protein
VSRSRDDIKSWNLEFSKAGRSAFPLLNFNHKTNVVLPIVTRKLEKGVVNDLQLAA